MKRWIGGALLGAAAAGFGALIYATRIERGDVRLDRFTLASDRPGLPPEGLTVLHLSDLHFQAQDRVQARKIARLKQLLADEEYDIVALTGDLIHDAAGFPVALALIETLRPRLGAFSVRGNHDYVEYSVWGVFGHTWRGSSATGRPGMSDLLDAARKLVDFVRKVLRNELVRIPVAFNDMAAMDAALAAQGIRPLRNAAAPVWGNRVWIAGVDDLTEGRPDLKAALADVPEEAFLILLTHNPDIWLESGGTSADLVLAGHTHGGQVRLPLVGAAHTQGTHLTRRQAAGWFERTGTRMFVSRGVGESIPLRFGVRPQAALIRIVSAEPA